MSDDERRFPTPEEAETLLRIQEDGATPEEYEWLKRMEKVWKFKANLPWRGIYGVNQ